MRGLAKYLNGKWKEIKAKITLETSKEEGLPET